MAADASAAARSPWSEASRAVEEPCRDRPREVPSKLHSAAERVARPWPKTSGGPLGPRPGDADRRPALVVGLQSYGGEGRYRTYLFALPWLCFFAAAALSPTRARLRTLRHRASLTLATVCLATCLLFA
jgi:hypothetical protein